VNRVDLLGVQLKRGSLSWAPDGSRVGLQFISMRRIQLTVVLSVDAGS